MLRFVCHDWLTTEDRCSGKPTNRRTEKLKNRKADEPKNRETEKVEGLVVTGMWPWKCFFGFSFFYTSI